MEATLIVAAIVLVALLVLALIVALALYGLHGIAIHFTLAVEHGAPGLILYLLLWIFLTPVMIVASIFVGWLNAQPAVADDREQRAVEKWRRKRGLPT